MASAMLRAAALLAAAAAAGPGGSASAAAAARADVEAAVEGGRSGGHPLAVGFVSFDDIIGGLPDRYDVQTSWDCIGHQPNSSYVYVCYTTWKNTEERSLFANQDTLVFRYDTRTGERRFIGTFLQAAAKAGNLWKGEIIPKGHTHIVHADGQMFIGSQNFHDFKTEINTTELDGYHGGHLFSIDTGSLRLTDATARRCPHGVGVDHEGILAQSHIPELNLLVGLTHPYSNLVLFNYKTLECKVVQGIPWSEGNPVSRELVALPNGHVYLYRGVEDPRLKGEDPEKEFPVWMYDHATGRMAPTRTMMSNGVWDSHAYRRDGTGIYIASSLGQLWYLDTATEEWSSLGVFLPRDRLDMGVRVGAMYTIALSPQEDKLYGIVSFYYPRAYPQDVVNGGDLYVKDLRTGEVSFVQFLGHGVYTGSGVTVGDSMYFAKAGEPTTGYWIGNVSLGMIRLGKIDADVEYV